MNDIVINEYLTRIIRIIILKLKSSMRSLRLVDDLRL
jgi:hypothetical protein